MISFIPTESPQLYFAERLQAFENSQAVEEVFALDYALAQTWLTNAPRLNLLALVALYRTGEGWRVAVGLAEYEPALREAAEQLGASREELRRWCEERQLAWFELNEPLRLETVAIPKPWGRELWYTGIEARGESRLVDDSGCSVPLSWLLSLSPGHILGQTHPSPILLKILDPLPEPVLGDLYFEMHEEKQEVYVVTHVDAKAWPAGVGGIRFGFDQGKRVDCGSDERFKQTYLAAVNAYGQVRRTIDEFLDRCRLQQGIALDQPVDATTLRGWLERVPADLQERERVLRAEMESFIHTDPLRVGDVVKVPCFTPHSLLHGVRTVEFQTPVYERKILSFAQKVLTQQHWDTEAAMTQVILDKAPAADLPVLERDATICWEEVAVFDDFEVFRLTLAPGASRDLFTTSRYYLLMAIDGQLSLGGRALLSEEAVLVSALAVSTELANGGEEQAVALLARPLEAN